MLGFVGGSEVRQRRHTFFQPMGGYLCGDFCIWEFGAFKARERYHSVVIFANDMNYDSAIFLYGMEDATML